MAHRGCSRSGSRQHGQVGKPALPDPRLDYLSALFNPKKTTPTRMEILDTPGVHPSERRDNPRRLAILRDSNGLLVVLDGFSGGSLTDELRRFREELLFADLEIVANRLDKLKDLGKKTKPAKQREAEEAETAPVDAHRRLPGERRGGGGGEFEAR